MAKNFAEIGFSKSSKDLQEKYGSRASYERMERITFRNSLTPNEIAFISNRDSFYISTVGENGFPYIQHRGGPKGFLKVLDEKRLGFIDFKGNMQYISVGNLATNNKVCLFLMDYPAKTRLKIYATTEIIELKENPELYELLNLETYQFRPERMMVFHIEAFDWNCPQHITPRYTLDEIDTFLAPQREYISKLEAEIKALKVQLTANNS
ncbi:pyridoxamine 5'-phosphate oxidase family protein [Emticicia sp. SJ17W-69]|uniref:pyridoxamine 5'-phosphate oxidase family protein n=1 Tax=Emticicia sp. SJ17W-69 TaxID=3421657 RepID=UPI003EC03F2B